MIDYEVKVFNRVYDAIGSMCAQKKFVSTQITSTPTAFPAADLFEMDNSTVRERQSSTPTENFALISYQLDVYATSKKEAKTVFAAADEAMISMNFSRMSRLFNSGGDNTKVVRYTARYEAVIDPDGNIYRRG